MKYFSLFRMSPNKLGRFNMDEIIGESDGKHNNDTI